MFSANQLNTLRCQLSSLSLQHTSPVSPEQKAYADFYSLPFNTASIRYHSGFLNSSGFLIFTQLWQPVSARGTVFITHGYFDHGGLYGHIIRFFIDMAYNVLIFDLPGHGLSSGLKTAINDFSDYSCALKACCAWARPLLPAPWHLFGQSTGAAIITDSMAIEYLHNSYPIEKIILCAPLVRIYHWRKVHCVYHLLKYFTKTVKRKYTINSGDPEFVSFISRKDPMQSNVISLSWINALYQWNKRIEKVQQHIDKPVFIIQGKKDLTVNWHYNIPFLASLYPENTLLYIDHARHHLSNESVSIRQQYLLSLKKWLD